MSDKAECPGCGSYTSTVLSRFRDGNPCPYCGLSASAAAEIAAIREGRANDEVKRVAEEAIKRAEKAEREAAHLRSQILDIRSALDRQPTDPKDEW